MKLVVIKSTESTNGGFVVTVEGTTVKKAFGVDIVGKHRFLVKSPVALAEGEEHEFNMNEWDKKEIAWENENGEQRTSVWLKPKAV